MAKYPQIYVVEKYQQFLSELTKVGKPEAVDRAYIRKLGFKSSYDDNFLNAIKFLGLVEDKRGGAPTQRWTDLRANFSGTLARCLKDAYSELFAFYPDAHLRDDEALTSFFRGSTEVSAEEVDRMVNAFNSVRRLAKFENGEETEAEVEKVVESRKTDNDETKDGIATTSPDAKQSKLKNQSATININIQLQLPADASGEIYDKFFESMKKHLPI